MLAKCFHARKLYPKPPEACNQAGKTLKNVLARPKSVMGNLKIIMKNIYSIYGIKIAVNLRNFIPTRQVRTNIITTCLRIKYNIKIKLYYIYCITFSR